MSKSESDSDAESVRPWHILAPPAFLLARGVASLVDCLRS